MEEFLEENDKAEVKKIMKQKPVIIFFFMNGCQHCERTDPAWKELVANKTKFGLPHKFVKVEASATPNDIGVEGFPHFHKDDDDGVEEVDGEKTSLDDLVKSLKLKIKKGGRRLLRRSRRRNTRRLVRRVRKTLR